jgi:hypothetical protein
MELLMRSLVALALVTGSVLAQAPAASESDPKIGRWRLRATAPASGTREYEERGCGVTISTRQGVNADGRAYYSQYVSQMEGKDYPRVVRGSQVANTIAITRVDAYTMAFTLKEDGKVVSHGTTAVSKDGKVLTVTTRRAGSDRPGGVEVYDRVE